MEYEYVKKPVVIQAWQFTKKNYSIGIPNKFQHPTVTLWSQYGGGTIVGKIETLEGNHTVSEDDWIICGVKGELYPCKPDIFEMTYEKVK